MVQAITATLHKVQGIPGQYQIAHNPAKNKLFVTGTFNYARAHGSTTSTIARIDPDTLSIEALAKLPVTTDDRDTVKGQYQLQGAFGLALDNKRGTLWVGSASTGSVTVYNQDDLSLVWDSLTAGEQIWQLRELFIDTPANRAYITTSGGYCTVDLDTFQVNYHNLPQQSGRSEAMLLGPIALEEKRELYIPDIINNQILVVDLNTAEHVRTYDVHAADYKTLPAVVHGVELSGARGELYVSTQGVQGCNSGVHILSLEGEPLDFIPYGKMPTDILYDATNALLYVTDFGAPHSNTPVGGTVGVIDVASRKVLGEIQVSETKTNHQVLLPNGAVVVSDKAGEHKRVRVPFHIAPFTGEFTAAETEERTGEQPRTIDADSITRLHVQVQGEPETAAFPVFSPPLRVLVEDEGADVEILADLPEGYPIEVTGSGWFKKYPAHGPRVGSEVVIEGDGVELARVQVQAAHFGALLTASIEFPTDWKAGQEHVITVRSGQADDDVVRSLGVPVRIVEAERYVPASAVNSIEVSAQFTDFTGYPELS
ncbi:MAG: hypothetical protein Q3991_10180 [Rothia sp. (in: high G+C Gram-positive bacteria)]|uniref:hypothetical protein n=1 Tax=Rothia sp. (in: high G+C Gram-positive bacteria) TaxID=1885016 RepID=UPI0026DAE778|nr:hypothetical protein [Rothia sp. (in: high G+C Gram-positive bacteria)]MDO4885296.1 hypothetical protein [Rothia sp. (in: high G+C Gram-positive bacteria)]